MVARRQFILVLIHGPSNRFLSDPTSIAWVSVADGTIRTIKVLEPWRSGGSALPRLSRDGKWIAYSAVARETSADRYIYVMDADGHSERVVATMAGSNTSPAWTPDAAHVVFVNSQGNRSQLFAVPVVADLRSAAVPVRSRGRLKESQSGSQSQEHCITWNTAAG